MSNLKTYVIHLFLDGTDRPLCNSPTGGSTCVVAQVKCVTCQSIIRDTAPRWRLFERGAPEVQDWLTGGERIAVCTNGKRVEVRARMGSVVKEVRKRIQAEAFPVVIDPDHTLLIPSNNALRPPRMITVHGNAARAALQMCTIGNSIHQQQEQTA